MSWVIKSGGGWGKNGVNERGESEVGERSEKVGEWKGIEWVSEGGQVRCVKEAEMWSGNWKSVLRESEVRKLSKN